jgi:hypothetical protein
MQLRRIVTEFPKIDPTSYAFTYADTASFEDEVDEWFSYNEAEFKRLHRAKDTFQRRWEKFADKTWLEVNREERDNFARQEINDLYATDLRRRCKSLQTILHIILGVWDETAGMEMDPKNKTRATKVQLEHMKDGILLVAEAEGISLLYEVMQNAFKRLWYENLSLNSDPADASRDDEIKLLEEDISFIQDELDNVTTIIYLLLEGVRNDPEHLGPAKAKLRKWNV